MLSVANRFDFTNAGRLWIFRILIFISGFTFTSRLFAVQEINVDVCVYGGTSGGVIAAVQAARMGKSVALVALNNHIGGMTTSGLGWTDIGHADSDSGDYIQGVSREFYNRIAQKYGGGTFKTTFEPHIAETVYNEMVQQAGVTVYTNQYFVSLVKNGQKIVAVTMNNGNIFRAKVFVDASYTADIMGAAGVTYFVGRESTNQYGESLNGIRPPNGDFTNYTVDPYIIPGNPGSGLIPLIQTNVLGTPGDADQRVQAYNFRLCLTTVASNKVAITAPSSYNTNQFELLARYVQALQAAGASPSLGTFLTINSMPNNKTDINNAGALSTDFVGESAPYVEADYTIRQQIWQAHRNYQQGFLYFLATDGRIPAGIRTSMQNYGFCKDEFTDNGGWSYEIYVREGRRMVSDYVMTQSNIFNQLVVPDSIGMGGYFTDSHYLQRVVINGGIRNEGNARGDITVPYPISYRALIPKTGECSNLLVPWCMSASHTAYSSIRMEPVFMILGQACGTAASFSIDENTALQNINIPHLQAQLVADGQLLYKTTNTTTVGSNNVVSLLLDFGPTTATSLADKLNSPAHMVGGLSGLQTNWNTIIADTNTLIYSDGTAAAGVTLELGRSLAGSMTMNFSDNGFTANNALGGQVNTGIYANNSPIKDAFFGGSGGANALAVGARINGLEVGTYTIYVTARNTSTANACPEQIYCTNGASATAYTFIASPSIAEANGSPANTGAFAVGDNCNLMTITLASGQSIFISAVGTGLNELRGFLNTIEIVPGLPAVGASEVDLWATDAAASRRGPAAGSFTLSRNGATSTPLTVNLVFSGTASNGVDYHSIASAIVLPIGVATTNISVLPFTNSLPVGNKTATVSLVSNVNYSIRALDSASVTISDIPINQWRVQYFGTDATNTAIAGNTANPSGDGIPNLIKYAFGLNPINPQVTLPVVSGIDANGYFFYSYLRPDPQPTDLTYHVQTSDDLSGWCTSGCVTIQSIIYSNDTALVTSSTLAPVDADPEKFFRLQVTQP